MPRWSFRQPRRPRPPCVAAAHSPAPTMDRPVLSSTRWRPSPGRHRSQTAPQMLTAPGERHRVGDGEVEAHSPEQCVQEPFGLAQREMVEEPQGQGGLDGEIRVPPLPTPLAAPAGRPGSDRFRGHPHRHIAAVNEGPIAGRPVRNAVLRLIRGMNLRLHPCSVAPAETRRAGQTALPAEGLSCNNATSRRPPLLVMFAVSSAPTAGGGLPPHPRPRGARTHVRTRTSPPPSLSRTGCRAAPGDPP